MAQKNSNKYEKIIWWIVSIIIIVSIVLVPLLSVIIK